ncbi:MAG TPA: DNA repair ATPase [Marinagarivorans sp.]
MSAPDTLDEQNTLVDSAVAQGGAYEVIRQRLLEQGKALKAATDRVNAERLEEFGSTDMDVIARVRVRTENNSAARDIVQVGEYLLFGYNVFIGLKKETKIDDVFSLFSFSENDGEYALEPVPNEDNFLFKESFKNDFEELYRYYKNTKLTQLTVKNERLLAAFQIGDRLEDMRVFRWAISADGKTLTYIDNRGERDIQLPNAYDFEWTQTRREDVVHGRHAHINIADTVFVDTTGGDLTIKIENNTEDGFGVYREPVDDTTQSLDDASVHYARVGALVLLKILPYREKQYRYFIYNTLTEEALRVDAIGESCQQLPEDHGIIFPGGYYLQTGEYKAFDDPVEGFRFKRMVRSPNGEDALYVFYEPVEGVVALLSYNLIDKALKNPIFGHGYALFDDGRIVIFTAEEEPSRVHPMQIWQSAFASMDYVSQQPVNQSFYGKIGNAELVRGISDLYSIYRIIQNQAVSLKLYEELSRAAHKIFDAHYWLSENALVELATVLKQVEKTSELVIDEFEKVESIRQQSAKAMQEAQAKQESLLSVSRFNDWDTVEGYVETLGQLRRHRGHLVTLKEYRYIDVAKLDALDAEIVDVSAQLSDKTVTFLSSADALTPYAEKIAGLNAAADKAQTSLELEPLLEQVVAVADNLDVLSELMTTLNIADATVRTQIVDEISTVYSTLNQTKARINNKQKNVGSKETHAQFSAQFKLFSQTINNALGQSTTPDKCEEQHARLLVQLEEFESQFSEVEEFLADIMAKREEVQEAFEAQKQKLLDEQQRKAGAVVDAASRILGSIEKRSLKFTDADELNTYFASDVLVSKVGDMVMRLRELNAAVQADDIDAKYKAIKEQAVRSLRDKTDIFEEGGRVIKLGPRHKFSVNQQDLDLTIIPRNDALHLHLSGTDFFEPLRNAELEALKPYWTVSLESESPGVYRAEYLAYLIIEAAKNNEQNLSDKALSAAVKDADALARLVRDFAAPRYKEAYEKGVHDHDAVRILLKVVPALRKADTLKYEPRIRALAQLFWCYSQPDPLASVELGAEQKFQWHVWASRAQSAAKLRTLFGSLEATQLLEAEISTALANFVEQYRLVYSNSDCRVAAEYCVAELARDALAFAVSQYAEKLIEHLRAALDISVWDSYQSNLRHLSEQPAEAYALSQAWLRAMVNNKSLESMCNYIDEAAVILCTDKMATSIEVPRRNVVVDLDVAVDGLLGDHPKLQQQTLPFSLNQFLETLRHHVDVFVPNYHRYLTMRAELMSTEREKLRLEEFKPRPLSSFVRNRLINESYLPIIGDNLAKQMGTVGENKRTDLMGLLMMISPPGYGKTTLMEYVASRLGLIFMKINCPSLGHNVLSLDPEHAPNATAKQELIKLNLALEMGNNVMLYLDDIQHTHPEFLQKFISLCDGTRRVEGVWKGKTKTYDMRGRKFCVVMAGNPYTESGEAFKVPDMLANRADIYNLGDILGGMDEQFAMSYIENSLTSNAVLAPLALRSLDDVYKLIAKAQGENIAATDLSHTYSGAEIAEICDVLKKMFVVRDVILKINQQYIASAAQNDKYRVEPPFKLQGSYRNMNKMAEKISAVMTDEELMAMIDDHYQGESQLLTSGSEDNLLKLAELRGNMTSEQAARWAAIKADFLKHKDADSDVDGAQRIALKISEVTDALNHVGAAFSQESTAVEPLRAIGQQLQALQGQLSSDTLRIALENAPQQPLADIAAAIEQLNRAVCASQSPEHKPSWASALEHLASQFGAFDRLIGEQGLRIDNGPKDNSVSDSASLERVADVLESAAGRLTEAVEKSIDFDITIVKRITKLSSELRGFSQSHRFVKKRDTDEFDELGGEQE